MYIRAVQIADYPEWLTLWQGYQQFYSTQLTDEVSKTTFQRFLDINEPVFCHVMEHEGKLIGFVHFIFHRSTWSVGNYCYLQDLFVDSNYRRLKIGQQLIENVYATANEAECSRVYWLTHESNAAARHLYDQIAQNAGFIQYRKNLNM
ncbi:GNAT family N-acetyltransferase [Acinetobacter sp. MD2(2019)]|uniref:GNAT family N-acetyltransferase n=1 Tax=Acinetobacter sp. MD2(2019) TaxID=2605273 RepID=UPI002D1F47E2|nr:GNAT family N-acetyltransferase [Acinetobacter sp. MD2(2019)]MEB3753431.1 GNAT family N-acetyltransferase [Acinetobacter sp. MD2(2019)]